MQEDSLYRILHISLSNLQALPECKSSEQGAYFVFWWKEIPLGQLFTEPGEVLDPRQFSVKMEAAIKPALLQYIQWTGIVTSELLPPFWNWLAEGKFGEVKTWLNDIFKGFADENIPQKVPVSVVICTRNRAASLERCLKQLRNLSCRPEEIIVVDNAPDDDSTRQVAERCAGVIYLLEERKGLSFARNTGVKAATKPIIAFTDDDVEVHPQWVYQVWKSFSDGKVAAMTGLVIASELATEAQLIFEKHWSFNRGYLDKSFDEQYFNANIKQGPPVWEIGAGANTAFRKDIFEQAGYFDERLGAGASGCSEDSEMWYRILLKGGVIKYNPRAIVFHEHRKSLADLKKQIYSYMRGFSAAALIQRRQYINAGYRYYLFAVLPKYYFLLLYRGFPRYRSRFRTVGIEIKGLISGLSFYRKNRYKPANKI